MYEKSPVISILALIMALAALGLSAFGLLRPSEDVTVLESLAQQNAQLQQQLNALSARVDGIPTGDAISEWTLTATAVETGAQVKLTAVPGKFVDGMKAVFVVRLEGHEISNVPCSWDGTQFTATAELEAADGYGYYCIVVDADGSREQIALSTPENPVEEIPVYLKSSLSAYCNMTVENWEESEGVLKVTLAYVQAQLPRLTQTGTLPTVTGAKLRLSFNGSDFSETQLTLEPGEDAGAYELTITGAELTLPEEMTEEDCLDLNLEITTSDGQTLTALGGSWYHSESGLFLVVG